MNYASVKQVRQVVESLGKHGNVVRSWTDKCADPAMRRVAFSVFLVNETLEDLGARVKRALVERGYDNPVKVTISKFYPQHRSGGNMYLRVYAALGEKP